jgi:hypothetical protein
MVVLKGTNFCPNENPACARGPHFDIASLGFDVLEFSLSNTCPRENQRRLLVGDIFQDEKGSLASCLLKSNLFYFLHSFSVMFCCMWELVDQG